MKCPVGDKCVHRGSDVCNGCTRAGNDRFAELAQVMQSMCHEDRTSHISVRIDSGITFVCYVPVTMTKRAVDVANQLASAYNEYNRFAGA